MASDREIAVKLRAEVAQYERDMGRAAKATTGFAKTAQGALGNVKSAQAGQADATGQLRVAQLRLQEVQSNGKASSASLAQAEENVASAQRRAATAGEAVAVAQTEAGRVADQSSTAMGRLALSAEANRESWSQVGGVLTGAGVAIAAVGTAAMVTGVQYNTLQQTTRAALTTLTGSAEAANAQMDRLDAFARESPFAKQTFIQAQQQMLGFGVATDKVLPALDAIQNTVAAFGGSNDQIAAIAEIMSRIQSEGRLSGDALQRLGYYGVDAAELIGSQMGKTSAEIREMASQPGGIPVAQIWDPLVQGMDQKFGGAADNVKNTFAGAIDRVMAAWRDLSSELAEPFVGTQGGGIFTGLLNETADVMRSMQDLPGPVKGTATAIGGLAGVGSLAAGGFLLLAPRVIETREALEKMGPLANGTATALGKAGRAAGTAAVAFAALQGIDAIFGGDTQTKSAEDFARALEGSAKSASRLNGVFQASDFKIGLLDGFQSEIGGLGDAFDAMEANWFTRLNDFGASGLGVWETRADLAGKSFTKLDAELTDLSSSGSAEEAAAQFELIAQEAEKSGVSTERLAELFPTYTEALRENENEQRATAESVDETASALEAQAASLGVTAEQLTAMREAAKGGADAVGELGAGFDYSESSAGDFIKHMREQTEALQDFQRNAYLAGQKGLNEGLITHLQALGPEGAAMLQQFAGASQSEIAKANAAWEGHQRQLESAKNAIDGIPNSKTTRFSTPGLANARTAIKEIDSVLRNLPLLREVRIRTIRSGDDAGNEARAPKGGYTGMRVPQGFAGGGIVPGIAPPDPRKDNVLALGATTGQPLMVRSGEWIVNEKASDANDEWLRAINDGLNMDDLMRSLIGDVPAFVDGGRLDRLRAASRIQDLTRNLRERGPKGRLKLRGYDRWIAQEELKEARAELADLRRPAHQRIDAREDASRAAESFRGSADLSDGALQSPAAVERSLQRSISDMATFTMLLIQLKKKGAAPWLLQQLQGFGPGRATIRYARMMLADTAKLRSTNALVSEMNNVAGVYGQVTADPRWETSKAWAGGLSAAQQQVINRAVNVNVTTDDPSRLAREIRRHSEHQLTVMAMGAGI